MLVIKLIPKKNLLKNLVRQKKSAHQQDYYWESKHIFFVWMIKVQVTMIRWDKSEVFNLRSTFQIFQLSSLEKSELFGDPQKE